MLDYRTLIDALMPTSDALALMEKYETDVDFRTPELCFQMASRALRQTLERRGLDPASASTALEQLSKLVQPLEHAIYDQFEQAARERLIDDDLDQWPVLAVALAFGDGIWSQDQVFFGVGIPVWTTRTVEIYLR